MPQAEDAIPARHEVERQLQRMLTHPLFAARPQQAKLFEFLVVNALDGKELTEKDIRWVFFPTPPYTPESSNVRTNMNFIRNELVRGYYEVQQDDPVIIVLPDPQKNKTAGGKAIKLPPGKAYKPSFTYNPRHDFARKYQLGLYHLRTKTPYELEDAIREFQDLIAQEPKHAMAHVGVAESMYLLAAFGRDTKEALSVAYPYATEAAALLPGSWHTQAALGVAFFFYRDVPRATAAFEKAIACDKTQTLSYGWYHAFLLATGSVTEALHLAQSQADAQLDDAYAKALYSAFLYLVRRFDDARAAIRDALALDHNCWLAYLVLALIQMGSADAAKAHMQIKRMQLSLRLLLDDWFFPGLSVLCLAKADGVTEADLASMHQKAAQMIEKESPPLWSQAALLALAANETDAVLTALRNARHAFDPLMLFMHLLPIFDPIRDHEEFQKLDARRLEYSD